MVALAHDGKFTATGRVPEGVQPEPWLSQSYTYDATERGEVLPPTNRCLVPRLLSSVTQRPYMSLGKGGPVAQAQVEVSKTSVVPIP